MSNMNRTALFGALVAAGLLPHVAVGEVAYVSPADNSDQSYTSRLFELQKKLSHVATAPNAIKEMAQFRDLPWTQFSQWAQCGTDVPC